MCSWVLRISDQLGIRLLLQRKSPSDILVGRSGVVKSEVLGMEEGQRVPTPKPQSMPCNTQFSPNLVSRHETYPLCQNGVDKRDERQGEKKRKKEGHSNSSPPSRFPPDDHHDPKRRGSGHTPPSKWEAEEKKESGSQGVKARGLGTCS